MLYYLPSLAVAAIAYGAALSTTARAQAPARESIVLDYVARIAVARNLGVLRAAEREREANAGVREARGRLFPTLGVEARYTASDGALDVGELINPAYRTLNQLTQSNRFPTDVSVTLPLRQESKLRTVMPLFNRS